MYSPESSDGKTRVFENEYVIFFKGEKLKCKLTTEWVGSEVAEGAQGNNYLQALIKLVNRYYSDVLEIKEESGEYYLYFLKKEFLLEEFRFLSYPKYYQRNLSTSQINSRRKYYVSFFANKTIFYFFNILYHYRRSSDWLYLSVFL